jgi:hypothetical protein
VIAVKEHQRHLLHLLTGGGTERGSGSSVEPNGPSGDPSIPLDDAPDGRLLAWLDRCRFLAESHLDGIEDPARELVDLAGGDRGLMEQARRLIVEALEHEPRNTTLVQMLAFWRRAFEKGSWTWEPNGLERSPYLS